jgi:hypothetical protein
MNKAVKQQSSDNGEQSKRSARFRRVFGSSEGKKVLDDLIDKAGMNRALFAVDARVQERNVATNDFLVWVIEQVNWKPKEKGAKDGTES